MNYILWLNNSISILFLVCFSTYRTCTLLLLPSQSLRFLLHSTSSSVHNARQKVSRCIQLLCRSKSLLGFQHHCTWISLCSSRSSMLCALGKETDFHLFNLCSRYFDYTDVRHRLRWNPRRSNLYWVSHSWNLIKTWHGKVWDDNSSDWCSSFLFFPFLRFIACTLYPIKKYVAISYLVSFFYDSAITFLSVMGLVYSSGVRQATLKGPNSSRLRKIILGNALYFLVLILISLSSGILPLINLDPGIIAVLSGPHTAATCCMSLKIFRQLRSSIVNPKATLDRTPGSSGSSEPSKQGFSSPPQAPTSFSRSREASFSSKREVPIYRISRPEEINLRPLGYETDDLEKLTTYDRWLAFIPYFSFCSLQISLWLRCFPWRCSLCPPLSTSYYE